MSPAARPAPVILPKDRPTPRPVALSGPVATEKPREGKPISRGQLECLKRLWHYQQTWSAGHVHPKQETLARRLGGISASHLASHIRGLKDWELLEVKQGGAGRAASYIVTAAGIRFLETGELTRELSGELKSSRRCDTQPGDNKLEAKTGELKGPSLCSLSSNKNNPSRLVKITPAPRWTPDFPPRRRESLVFSNQQGDDWPRGGWQDSEDFERWWTLVVEGHPNKNRNGIAKTKALELVLNGTLNRKEFDEGYRNARTAAADRWTEQHGRFAPNLWQFLDDTAWKFAARAMPPAPEYQSAEDYLRRVENECS